MLGFKTVSCGCDSDEARAKATRLNAELDTKRVGLKPPREFRIYSTKVPATAGFVYFLRSGENIKIGFSRKPWERLRDLNTGLGAGVKMFLVVKGSSRDERLLHRIFAATREHGEWFKSSPELSALISRISVFGCLPGNLANHPPVTRRISHQNKPRQTSDRTTH